MDKLLLNERTRRGMGDLIKKPAHATIITGPSGAGKTFLAENLSAKLLGVTIENLKKYPYFDLIERLSDKKEISIEQVRQVIEKLRLKPVINASSPVNQVVLINNAQFLSAEAQNALLKAIEEPPKGTIFILTAVSDTAVLPTIKSRAQKLPIVPVELGQSVRYFSSVYPLDEINSAWSLSQGCVGLMMAILENKENHVLKSAVDEAKKMLTLGKYDRITFLDNLSSNKDSFLIFLDALTRILAALHHSGVKNGKKPNSSGFITARRLINSTIDATNKNASVKLVVLNLALAMPV